MVQVSSLGKAAFAAVAFSLAIAGPASRSAIAQPPAAAPVAASSAAEEIVVIGQRSGIPVWRVTGEAGTVVLVGSIEGVTKDTRWNPAALTEALRKADRVIYPGVTAYTASPFAMIGWLAKWRRQASLPEGQSLAQMLPPEQFRRLVALKDRGVLGPGFERKHPLHLAMMLRGRAKAGIEYGSDADSYVRKAVKKHKLNLTPLPRKKAKPLAQELFGSSPRAHLPCLIDAIALAEAGPAAIRARSTAWAERRVPAVLASPAEKVFGSCWPAATQDERAPAVRAMIRRLLAEPKTTVAVVTLSALARPEGILDDLERAGYDLRGPAWRN